MHALVTGATGFIGSAVARQLLAAGHRVRALVRETSDPRNLEGLDVEIATGDLRDAGAVERAAAGCDAAFHLAADYRLWAPDREALFASNVQGTVNVVHACARAGVARLVYTSSVAALGLRADGEPADEDTPVYPEQIVGAYKRSKFDAERAALAAAAADGLDIVVVNPSAPVGPRDVRPTPTGRIIVDAVRGRMPVYVDTGLNLAHVEDVAAGHLLAYEHGARGERYILGGDNLLLRDILGHVARIAGVRAPVGRIPHAVALGVAYVAEGWARATGATAQPMATVDGVKMSRKRMFFTSARAREHLGYAPRSAVEGLRDAIEWFRANGYC